MRKCFAFEFYHLTMLEY